MHTWKKDNEDDWILIDEKNKIIATITLSKNNDLTFNVEAICKKIGYTCRFENIDKYKLKTVMRDLKKLVKIEINHLREDNQKPVDKKIYKMIDSIPIWTRLKNGQKIKLNLQANDYGKFSELLGNRVLHDVIQRGDILENLFSGIEIISCQFIKKFKVTDRAKIGLGDIVFEVDYQKDDVFGKKIVIFEIKHGKIIIGQNQLRRYCSMILHPEEFFHKADEVRIIYIIFDDIDTLNASAFYIIKELDIDFAKKIMEQEPVGEEKI